MRKEETTGVRGATVFLALEKNVQNLSMPSQSSGIRNFSGNAGIVQKRNREGQPSGINQLPPSSGSLHQ